MEYYKSLDVKGKKEIKLGALIMLLLAFVLYILPSGFLNKYQVSLSSDPKSNQNEEVKFDPYNSGLSLVVRSMGDESGARPAWQSIVLNSNPLISASDTTLFAEDTKPVDPDTSNVTDLVARDLYVADKALKSSGASPTDKAAVAAALTTSVSGFVKAKIYTAADINISSDNSNAAIASYSKIMSTAGETTKNITPLTQYAALQNYITTKDIKYLNALTPDIAHLQASLDTTLKVAVPSNIAKAHLDMVNLISTKLTSFTNIRLSSADPARGLVALASSKSNITLEGVIMAEYMKALGDKGVAFRPTYINK